MECLIYFLIVHINIFFLPSETIQMQGFLEISRQEKLKDTENLFKGTEYFVLSASLKYYLQSTRMSTGSQVLSF